MMKRDNIKLRRVLLILLVVAGSFLIVALAYSQDKFKLKPGARGKICLNCHVNFEDKLKNPFIHTPVKTGDCSGCHNPHTSYHDKLLAADRDKICYKCHQSMIPENSKSAHKVVVEGNCILCHDPHGASNKFNLLRAGNELCFGCHTDMAGSVKSAKFRHKPVEEGCLNCHNPHASTEAAFLLKDNVPSLCLRCHQTDKPSFVSRHMNYPVAKGRCTSCHNPHGSNRGSILFDNVHKPVENRMCNQCHVDPTSQTPFATKKPGYELCMGCHSNFINDVLSKDRIHWPVVDKKGCLNCHNPHASPENYLLKKPMKELCGTCHEDTIRRQERSETKHPPIQEGQCTACHLPHSSDYSFLWNQSSILDVCGNCHNWSKHATHPVGEKFRDKRNKNIPVTCLSCHRAHGTEYKKFIPFTNTTTLCIQCHAEEKR
jgi:DmsE family decaheme c-type cytochrome